MKNIIDAMKWRYSVNKFDVNKKLTEEELNTLLEALILSPSSYGLQPWKFIVVTNPDIRTKLQEAGYGQPKITESSHLIVFAVEKNINEKLVENYINSVSKIRGVPVENLKGYSDMITGAILSRTPEQKENWATKQVYLALGVLIASAATLDIDVGPMEGFDANKFDEILGLEKIGLKSKVVAVVGFRSSDDKSAEYKKVRFSKEEIVIEIK